MGKNNHTFPLSWSNRQDGLVWRWSQNNHSFPLSWYYGLVWHWSRNNHSFPLSWYYGLAWRWSRNNHSFPLSWYYGLVWRWSRNNHSFPFSWYYGLVWRWSRNNHSFPLSWYYGLVWRWSRNWHLILLSLAPAGRHQSASGNWFLGILFVLWQQLHLLGILWITMTPAGCHGAHRATWDGWMDWLLLYTVGERKGKNNKTFVPCFVSVSLGPGNNVLTELASGMDTVKTEFSFM